MKHHQLETQSLDGRETFKNHGNTDDRRRSVRPKRSAQRVNQVRELFEEHPRTSSMTSEMEALVPSSVNRILSESTELFPCRIIIEQALSTSDQNNRRQFPRYILGHRSTPESYFSRVVFFLLERIFL